MGWKRESGSGTCFPAVALLGFHRGGLEGIKKQKRFSSIAESGAFRVLFACCGMPERGNACQILTSLTNSNLPDVS